MQSEFKVETPKGTMELYISITTPDPSEYDYQEVSDIYGYIGDKKFEEDELEEIIGNQLDSYIEEAIGRYYDYGGVYNEYAD